ncbi:MAG TPA: hypothetical protein VHA06_21135 [Candidatus Angelobacter sp.]|jgi:hypothetical protein|nr:hypothetical protein [Candidatus Angelobacter sp.]
MAERLGPNVKSLILRKMSIDAIPKGGGFADALAFLTTEGAMAAGFKAAREWTETAIRVLRLAAEPNPWKDADDETIAAEILQRIEAQRAEERKKRDASVR